MRPILALLVAFLASPAFADSFAKVSDRTAFMDAMGDRNLRLGLFGVNLDVRDNGTVVGRALGYDVTGTWSWEGEYFCRELDWGGTTIPYNCQLVEVSSSNQIRFTVDQGAGDDATFNLR